MQTNKRQTWLVSDLHLFHENIMVYCNRDFNDVYAMNEHIVKTWNNTVADNDRVIIIGDLSASLKRRQADLAAICTSLRGNKILIRGNHDYEPDDWYIENCGFDGVYTHLYEDGMLFVHQPATSRCMTSVDLVEQIKPKIVVHGHIHTNTPNIEGHFNVAWDRFNRMISLNEVPVE